MKRTEIIDNIRTRAGFESLNPMQQTMADTDARDIILIAPTGSGKTLAFIIRMLRNVDVNAPGVKAVVMAPTRELVLQLADVTRTVATGLKTVALYGGHNMSDEVNSLSVAPDIVIATPGRLVDHITRRTIDIDRARTLVIDEYDKMLELGFYDQMQRVARHTTKATLRILTSATELDELPEFMGDASSFTTYDYGEPRQRKPRNVEVLRVTSPDRDKLDTLIALLRSLDHSKVIVFVNHRESAERIYDRLHREGFPVGLYHGGLEQHDRRRAVDLLDNGTTPILVSTDIAARGLDIDSVGHVIHYHLPVNEQAWTHRNGRTGRQDATGTVWVITTEGEALPDYATIDRDVVDLQPSVDPIRADWATVYINAGKKEKISRGDIAGYLMQRGGLSRDEVGRIVVDDHWAIAAVARDKASAAIAAAAPHRLKNTRVRLSLLK